MTCRTKIDSFVRIMNAKLTLKLDQNVIQLAKEYSKQHHVSLSKLIETQLKFLVTKKKAKKVKVSGLVQELSGVISLPEAGDMQALYGDFLIEKYV